MLITKDNITDFIYENNRTYALKECKDEFVLVSKSYSGKWEEIKKLSKEQAYQWIQTQNFTRIFLDNKPIYEFGFDLPKQKGITVNVYNENKEVIASLYFYNNIITVQNSENYYTEIEYDN